jgi:lactoylglutathione lyase
MIRVNNLEESLAFYKDLLGMNIANTINYPDRKLVHLRFGENPTTPTLELAYHDGVNSYEMGNAFGHIAFSVSDIYATCKTLASKDVKIIKEPGQGRPDGPVIAFIEDPNGYKIELIQKS